MPFQSLHYKVRRQKARRRFAAVRVDPRARPSPFHTVSSLTQKEMASKRRAREFTRVKVLSLAQGVCFEDIEQRTLSPSNITVRGRLKVYPRTAIEKFSFLRHPAVSPRNPPPPKPVFPLRTHAEDRKGRGITGFGDLNFHLDTLFARAVPNTVGLSARSADKQTKNDLWDDFSSERIQDLCHASRAQTSRDLPGYPCPVGTTFYFCMLQYTIHITSTFMYSLILERRPFDVTGRLH
jgi:hypothetical protein